MIGINVLVSTRNEDAVDIKRKKREREKKGRREEGRKEGRKGFNYSVFKI